MRREGPGRAPAGGEAGADGPRAPAAGRAGPLWGCADPIVRAPAGRHAPRRAAAAPRATGARRPAGPPRALGPSELRARRV